MNMWHKSTTTEALLDCGATNNFIDPRAVKTLGIGTKELHTPLTVNNVDGTVNRDGTITHFCNLWARQGSQTKKMGFYVANLGRDRIILGYPWFRLFNPDFDWAQNTLKGDTVEIDTAGYRQKQKVQIHATQLTNTAQEVERTEVQKLIPEQYHQHWEVFSELAANRFPPAREEDHAIVLKEGAPATIDCKVYRQTETELEATRNFIQDSLAKGYITDSKSPYASGLFYRAKADGKLRPIMDYRALNKWTVRDTYPLPLIGNILDHLQGKTLFTKFDIRWGFNNIHIKEEDQWKAAFKTPFGLYEPTVMYFGLTNSPATFCRAMRKMLRSLHLKYPDEVFDFVDDVLVATRGNKPRHRQIVNELLTLFAKESYFLRPAKCEFEQTRVTYLGLVVDGETLRIDPKKADGLHNWPRELKTVKEVRSVLGVLGYQHPFIPHYADLARPLTALTKKDHPFKWTDECRTALDTLINAVTKGPVLAQPDLSLPFFLQVDASAYATGAILTQQDERKKHRAIAFFSKTFNEAERNYDIHDRELVAVYRGLTHWQHLLLSSPFPVMVLTDHKNLEYYKEPHHINRRIARYVQQLADYNFILKHIPGEQNKADALSRRPNYPTGTDDNSNVTVLPPHLFCQSTTLVNLFTRATTLSSLDERVHAHQLKQPDVLQKWATTYPLKKEGELFWYGDRLVVMEDASLRRGVISLYHNSTTAGHPGISNTAWAITRDFWWPALKRDVTEYVKGCPICQSRKNQPNKAQPPLFPISSETYSTPFSSIAMDFIVKLPLSESYDTILTITDTFSKASIFIPCNETIDAVKTAKLYTTYVLPHYGLPSRIISDRDPRFTSTFSRELCRALSIDQNISTAYDPQTDGQSERTNQRLEQYLRIFINSYQTNWASLLPLAQYTLNATPNATTHKAPFQIILGYIPKVHQTSRPFRSPSVEVRLEQIKQARFKAASALHKAADLELPSRFSPYQKGDKVWLEGRNLTTTHPTAKLAPRRYSPFPITRIVSRTSYQLQLPAQWKIHNVFHASLLTPYKETSLNGSKYQEPAPDLIDGQPEWEVEQILRSRRYRNQLQYQVRWKGFSEAHDSWEPATHIYADKLLQDFYKKHPTAAQNLTTPPTTTIRTMTTSPALIDHLDSPPTPLSLSDRLGPAPPQPSQTPPPLPPSPPQSPQPIIVDTCPSTPETDPLNADLDLADFGKDYSTPEGFVVFDRTIPDHHHYGRKFVTPEGTLRYPHYIKFAIDHVHHHHYVYGARDDINEARTHYGWPLQAQAFIGPVPAGNHSVDPAVLVGDEEQQVHVDIVLLELRDKGVAADVDLYRELVPQEESIRLREIELKREKELWALRHQEVKDRLHNSRAMARLHPYLTGASLVQDPHYQSPHSPPHPNVTLDVATQLCLQHNIRIVHMPQLHDEPNSGNRPNRHPLPHPIRCRKCKQLNPDHQYLQCPALQDCLWCGARNHSHKNCPNPHSKCYYKTRCNVPYIHKNGGRYCPIHDKGTDDYEWDGDDGGAYDDVDWESFHT